MTSHFKDWQAAKDIIVSISQQDPFKTEYVQINLTLDGFIKGDVKAGKDRFGYTAGDTNNQPKDQKVIFTKYDDKPKGQYMRVKPSDVDKKKSFIEAKMGNNLLDSFIKKKKVDNNNDQSVLSLVS